MADRVYKNPLDLSTSLVFHNQPVTQETLDNETRNLFKNRKEGIDYIYSNFEEGTDRDNALNRLDRVYPLVDDKIIKKYSLDPAQVEELKSKYKGLDLENAIERLKGGEPFGDILNGLVTYEDDEEFEDVDADYERSYGPVDTKEKYAAYQKWLKGDK